jgi:hypothetical protein
LKKRIFLSIFIGALLLLMPIVSSVEKSLIRDETNEKFNFMSNFFILKILIFFWLISPIFNLIKTIMMDNISIFDFNLIGLITLFYSSLIVNLYFFISNIIFIILIVLEKLFGEDEWPSNKKIVFQD